MSAVTTAVTAVLTAFTLGVSGPPTVLGGAAPPWDAAPAALHNPAALSNPATLTDPATLQNSVATQSDGSPATSRGGLTPAALRLARQTLPLNDGWAASGAGTTGGAAADDAHIAVVRNRAELIAALGGDAATNAQNAVPKIILVSGRIDLNEDATGKKLTCADYADPDYSLSAFLAAYDPAVWGRTSKPSGPLEDARARSAANQSAQVRIYVGSNTTIVGVNGGEIEHGNLLISNASNVIVRNLEFADAADCFPAWDPTDGDSGNWNSLYDLVSVIGSTNVWLDHNTFSDGANPDSSQPLYLGRPYQVHDGATDLTKGSDLLTVSYNDYYNHDKTMLIGSTDTPGVDVGKLRVTVHHNRFANVDQRAPRVRFGQVDVYDNLYVATDAAYQYSLGVGIQSSIYAENNFFRLSTAIPASSVIRPYKGTNITAIGSLVQIASGRPQPVDLVAAYNAAYDPDLIPDAGWTPTLRTHLDPTWSVPAIVSASAGAHHLLH